LATKIILARHGHIEGISPRRFRGRKDVPLSTFGRAQAEATAKRISATWRPSVVYTSPLGRCVATGAAIAAACGVEGKILDALNDLDYGTWQWKTHDEMEAAFPELYKRWHIAPQLCRFPKGESLQDLVARAGDVLRYVLKEHHEEVLVLVGHDSVNRALLMQGLEQSLFAYWRTVFDPCGISEIDFVGDTALVRRVNELAHLEHLAKSPSQR
jgi:probable phosphoglycerate mutase